MRLIDADTLEKLMTEDWFLEILATQHSKNSIKKDIENAIDSVPLAYDVEKVVEQIYDEIFVYDIPKDIVTEIVRKGGVE